MNTTTERKIPLPNVEDSAKAQENYDRYLYARQRGHAEFLTKATECDNFVFDAQWTKEEIAVLRKVKRPALTINKIKPALFALLDEYIKNRVEVKFVPSAGGDPQTASAHTKLFRHISNAEDLRAKELDLVIDGLITSRAYYLVRIGFDDNYRGEVRIQIPNPKNVIPDPDSDSYDPANWSEFIVLSFQSLNDIEFNYGWEKRKLVEMMGEAMETHDRDDFTNDTFAQGSSRFFNTSEGLGDENLQKVYRVIERQYRRVESAKHFHNVATGDLRRIPPHWDAQDIAEAQASDPDLEVVDEDAQVIRWTVSCGTVLLHDGLSPYRSLGVIPYFPFFRRGRSAGGVESLLDPQRNYNKLRSSEQHIVSGTANTGWKVRQGSLTNMSVEDLEKRGSAPGLVLEFRESPDDIERIQPAMIPQGMDRISQKADADLREISGIPDEQRTLSSPATSGKRIEAQQKVSLITATIFFENLQRTRRMLVKKVLELVQAFYSEQRQLVIIGEGVAPETETLEVNAPQPDGSIKNDLTSGEYDVVITPAPARDSHDQAQFELLMQMQTELKIPIPPHLFVEFSSLERKDEIAEEIKRLTGSGVPSEEERQLQMEEKQLQMEERRAAVAARTAQAMLSNARAQKVMREIEKMGELDDEKFEKLMQQAEELDIRRRQTEGSLEIRRRAQENNELKTLLQSDLDRDALVLEVIKAIEERKTNNSKRGDRNEPES